MIRGMRMVARNVPGAIRKTRMIARNVPGAIRKTRITARNVPGAIRKTRMIAGNAREFPGTSGKTGRNRRILSASAWVCV
jgi:hypothetical protein